MNLIGPTKGIWKGPYLCRIVSSEEIEAGGNRWEYVVRAARLRKPSNVFEDTIGGTWENAINLAESINTPTTVEGQPLGSDAIVPIADGMAVMVWLNGNNPFFTMPNQWVCA